LDVIRTGVPIFVNRTAELNRHAQSVPGLITPAGREEESEGGYIDHNAAPRRLGRKRKKGVRAMGRSRGNEGLAAAWLAILLASGASSGGENPGGAAGRRPAAPGPGRQARARDAPLLRLRGGETGVAMPGASPRGGGGAAQRHRYASIRVPADVEDVDVAIEMVPASGDTIEFGEGRHVLDECAVVRWGMQMRFVGARSCAGGEHPTVSERSEVWGNWTLLQSTMGEWQDLKLGLHCYMSQFTLFDIRGGPWEFTRCDTRCIGGIAIELLLRAKLIMTSCGVGGIDSQHMRAQDGLVCRMDSCADLESCCIELCGVLLGYGVQLLEDARASLSRCRILDNAVGACAEGNTCLALSTCTLAANRWAPLYCGPSADKVTLTLDTCAIAARCGYVFLSNRRPGPRACAYPQ
jgi:hypothetical protein